MIILTKILSRIQIYSKNSKSVTFMELIYRKIRALNLAILEITFCKRL